ncbi:hypothetical protein BKA56DRAFT_125413 [Ilyonectria sp. MPI-CAGE-AT-0026]|nr:hypothetical protein BKA56DRAFT_125413 [Ilyonectria sp. MPI-CAGE-AT-0026]
MRMRVGEAVYSGCGHKWAPKPTILNCTHFWVCSVQMGNRKCVGLRSRVSVTRTRSASCPCCRRCPGFPHLLVKTRVGRPMCEERKESQTEHRGSARDGAGRGGRGGRNKPTTFHRQAESPEHLLFLLCRHLQAAQSTHPHQQSQWQAAQHDGPRDRPDGLCRRRPQQHTPAPSLPCRVRELLSYPWHADAGRNHVLCKVHFPRTVRRYLLPPRRVSETWSVLCAVESRIRLLLGVLDPFGSLSGYIVSVIVSATVSL